MAPFSNAFRHLWNCGLPSAAPMTDSIANLDGTIEDGTGSQLTSESLPQQQDSGTLSFNDLLPASQQYRATAVENAQVATDRQQHQQPTQKLAVPQNTSDQDYSHSLDEAVHRRGSGSDNGSSAQQIASRTVTAPPSGAPASHSCTDDHLKTCQPSNAPAIMGTEVPVKEVLVTQDLDHHDVFAEFTNQGYHDDDCGSKQPFHNSGTPTNETTANSPSIKPERDIEAQISVDTTTSPETVAPPSTADQDVAAASSTTQDQPSASLATRTATNALDDSMVAPSETSEAALHLAQNTKFVGEPVSAPTLEPPQPAVISGPDMQYSFEQFAQAPQQPVDVSHTASHADSADSVVSPGRHSSEEAASSPGGLDLEANAQFLAQQWSQRQSLFKMGMLTSEAVQADPSLLHSPVPNRQQQDESAPYPWKNALHRQRIAPEASTERSNMYAPPLHARQQNSNPVYHGHLQHPAYPMMAPVSQLYPQWMPTGFVPNSLPHPPAQCYRPTQVHPTHGLAKPQCVTEVKQEELDLSDDDEPLVTRAPRHRSMTASPTIPASVLQPVEASAKGPTPQNAANASVSRVRGDPVNAPSDDSDEEAAEPISWKLPDFEATYYPPSKADEMPVAKVSIPNLVREEVALTEDHDKQEMQLFIDVFLPAQQALQAPDPEPAHAVLNFHTISVMVLEAFVQYEIGDEMGRGYGFHSGNVEGARRRPTPSASDEEPTRTRSAKDADVDEIFFAVIDRWRAGLLSNKGTLKQIRGCQEFCDIALDVIHYVKEHGLLLPEPKKRKTRSDKGVARGPRDGAKEKGEKENNGKGKTTAKRKAGAVEGNAAKKGTKFGKAHEVPVRKKAKVEPKEAKPKAKSKAQSKAAKSGGVIVVNSGKK